MTMFTTIQRSNVIRGASSDTFYAGLQVGQVINHVFTFTAAQMHDLYNNPVELLPLPQAGRAWWVHYAYFSKLGSPGYSDGGTLRIRYDAPPPFRGISAFFTHFMTGPREDYGTINTPSGAIDAFTTIRHAAVMMTNDTQPFTGAGADVTITLRAVLVDIYGQTVTPYGTQIPRNNVIRGATNDKYDPLGRAARFYISRTTVTPDQFILLRNQPVELLPAPPAGTWYQVEGVLMEKTGAVGYGAGNAIRVRYIGGGDTAAWNVLNFRGGPLSIWGAPGNPGVAPHGLAVQTGGLEVYNVSTDFALDGGPIDFSTVYCLVDT